MTPERWRQITEIFQRALARDAAERESFVAAECRDDEALRREVASMLAAHGGASGFGEIPARVDGQALNADSPLGPALAVGTRLGSYEVLSLLGTGGMGVVYRARDTRLQRDVAVKVLLPAVANDPDRLARLSREARVLASLNHANIAHVYGFEEADGVPAIAMELVTGPTLADRIAQGALPLADALGIAKQLAEALEAAHEHGIIHRDLKPANVKVRADGTVKVLDFGLAKTVVPRLDLAEQTSTATEVTVPGVILGTAPYMSPEQAKGQPVDRRADLWAFGCVLFEMLTGRRAFEGATKSDVLAKILEQEPDWRALPAKTPASIRRLLQRCLEKDPKRRLDSAVVSRIEITDALTAPIAEVPAAPPSRRVLPVAIAAVAGAALTAAVGTLLMRSGVSSPSAPPSPVSRFAITLPPAQPLAFSFNDRDIAISSDGTYLAHTAGDQAQLMVRALDQLEAVPLAGIVNARAPFFSADGRWIGFFDRVDEGVGMDSIVQRGTLRKVPASGGPPIVIASLVGASRGATWAPDETIVFATSDPSTGLLRVPAKGGEPEVLTKPEAGNGERDHYFPSVLPGARGVLFTIRGDEGQGSHVAILDLKTGQHSMLIRSGSQAEYVETGHLVYSDAGALWAARFDLTTLNVVGHAVPVIEQVVTLGAMAFAASRQGNLVYVPVSAGRSRSLVWVTRQGGEETIPAAPRGYRSPRLSPDGARVAVQISEDQSHAIWIWTFPGQKLTQLTFHPNGNYTPVWTPDGRYIISGAPRDTPNRSNLFRHPADRPGTEERLTISDHLQRANAVSPDGAHLVLEQDMPPAGYDLMLLSLNGTPRLQPLLQTPFDERNAEISPDGRWMAYESSVSGQSQVYVRPFANVEDARHLISNDGGRTPAWSPNGRELFFVQGNSMMAVPVQLTPTFSAGNPTKLFEPRSIVLDGRFIGGTARTYDVSHDGRRFLMIKENAVSGEHTAPQTSLVVVQNWFEELKSKVP